MLPKRARITQIEFKKTLINKAFFVQTTLFSLRVSDYPGTPLKVACTISKKEAKTAVLRNKLRRRCYRAVEKYQNELIPNHALVFSIKRQADKVTPTAFNEEVHEALRKAKILS